MDSKFDYKTSKVLAQTYFIVTYGLFTASLGLFINLYYNSLIMSAVSIIALFVSAIVLYFSQSLTTKFVAFSIASLSVGIPIGLYINYYELEVSEVVFIAIATILISVTSTITAFFTRQLAVFYFITLSIVSLISVVVFFYWLFSATASGIYLLYLLYLVTDVIVICLDTMKITKAIEDGETDPFKLAYILVVDVASIFIDLLKLKDKMKKDE